jgi:hypothetical protein
MLQAALATSNESDNSAAVCEGMRRLIVKLRWMGLDLEADRICHQLENLSPQDCVQFTPEATD